MRKRVRVPLLVRRVAQRTGVSAVELFDGGAEPWADEVHAHADWRCEPRCSVYAQGGAARFKDDSLASTGGLPC